MTFSYVNIKRMNMFGYGAMPMLPIAPLYTGHCSYHCSPAYNIGSMLTSMALLNNVWKTSMKFFSPFLPKVSNNTASTTSNNIFTSNNSNWLFGSFSLPSLNLFSYNSGYVPTPQPFIPYTPFKSEIKPITFESNYSKALSASKKTYQSKNNVVVRTPSTTTTLADVAKIYDPEKGKKLAQATINGLSTADKGYCARAVKTAIQNTGLGAYESGHANAMPSILGHNANFKEVKVSPSDLDNLPAGCVLCYAPGDCGYNAEAGHTEVTDGNGNAFHFAQTRNIRQSDNVRVFVPV